MGTLERPIENVDLTGGTRFPPTARTAFIVLACAGGLNIADAASARDHAPRNIRGWTVVVGKDGKGCFLTRQYERNGGTTLLLGLDTDGTNRLTVLNANWSIKPKDKLTLNFRLSNSSYPEHFAVGMTSEGKRGFVTSFGAKFPSYFAASRILHISLGDVPVERLDLDGGAPAIAALTDCVDDLRAKPPTAGERDAHPDDIPTDPFASAAAR